MKKFLALLLSLSMVLALSACGGTKSDDDNAKGDETKTDAPAVLMTAYAVRGLDINTSYTIYNLLTEQKMKGIAVMYVGEDLDVLLELCDRIVVLCGGQVSGVVDARTADKRQIGALMTRMEGGKTDE